jgi:hypothetical protein
MKLNASQREDLSDARLVLDTATHNVQAALLNPDPEESREAFEAALRQTEQALNALQRVNDSLNKKKK